MGRVNRHDMFSGIEPGHIVDTLERMEKFKVDTSGTVTVETSGRVTVGREVVVECLPLLGYPLMLPEIKRSLFHAFSLNLSSAQ